MQVSYAASTHNVPSVVTQVAGGCFRSIDQHDVLLTRESHLELLGSTPAVPSDHQGLAHESLFIQPIHGAIRDLAVLPPLPSQDIDRVAFICSGQCLHVWQYDRGTNRFAEQQLMQLPRLGYGKHGHGWRLTVDPPTGAVAITANGDRVLLLIPDAHGVLQQPGVVYCRNRFEYAYDDDANAGLPSAVQFTAACFSAPHPRPRTPAHPLPLFLTVVHRDDNHKPQLTLLACTDGTMLHEEAGVEWSDRKFECASPSPMVLVPVPGAPDVVVVAVGRALVYCRWAPVTFDYAVHKEGTTITPGTSCLAGLDVGCLALDSMPPKHGVAAAIHDDGDGGHVQDTTPLVGEHAIERSGSMLLEVAAHFTDVADNESDSIDTANDTVVTSTAYDITCGVGLPPPYNPFPHTTNANKTCINHASGSTTDTHNEHNRDDGTRGGVAKHHRVYDEACAHDDDKDNGGGCVRVIHVLLGRKDGKMEVVELPLGVAHEGNGDIHNNKGKGGEEACGWGGAVGGQRGSVACVDVVDTGLTHRLTSFVLLDIPSTPHSNPLQGSIQTPHPPPTLLATTSMHTLAIMQVLHGVTSWQHAAWEGGGEGVVCNMHRHTTTMMTSTAAAPAVCVGWSTGDVRGMGEPQIYAAAGNAVDVMLGGAGVTTHFSTGEVSSHVTGMWGAHVTITSPPTMLAVLSFLGATRVMAVHGTQFLDVTSDINVSCEHATIAAGLVAPNVLAQVTCTHVLLLHLQPESNVQAMPPRAASGGVIGDVPRQLSMTRRSSSSRLLDMLDGMSISPAHPPLTDDHPTPPPTPLPAPIVGTRVGSEWLCPGEAHLAAAVVVHESVWVYVPETKTIVVLCLDVGDGVQQQQQAQPTRSPGKRKRHAYALLEGASVPLTHELSAWDVRNTGQRMLCTVCTTSPDITVMVAYGGALGMRVHTVARLSLDAATMPALYQAQAIRTHMEHSVRESVVHSVAIVDSESSSSSSSSSSHLDMLVAMRSGQILQLAVGLTLQPPVFELVHHWYPSTTPTTLVPLPHCPTFSASPHMCMLLADRAMLLKQVAHGSFDFPQPLALHGITAVLPVPLQETSGLMLLCGTQNGALQLVEVPADSCFVESLDCDGDVTHVLADEHSHKVFVATTRTNHKHSPSTPAAMSVEALDPYTGDAHVVLRLGRDETVTAFCKWELDEGKMHAMVVGTQGVMHADVGRVLVINITEHRRHNPSDEMVTKLKLSKPVRTLYPLDGTRLVVSVDYQLLVYTLQQSTLVRQHWLSTSRTVTALHCHEDVVAACDNRTVNLYTVTKEGLVYLSYLPFAEHPSACCLLKHDQHGVLGIAGSINGVVWVFYARKQEGMSTSESQAIVLGSIKVGGNVVDIQTMAKQHQRSNIIVLMLHNGVFVTLKKLSDDEYQLVHALDNPGTPLVVWNSESLRHTSRAPLLHKYKQDVADDDAHRKGLPVGCEQADNEGMGMLLKLSALLDNCDY